MTRPKQNALGYLRRSTDKQEISLPSQLEWEIDTARRIVVALDASLGDLDHMLARRLHAYKAIRLDDGISGADLTRPGFLALNHDAVADRKNSHILIYKRDRYARPEDAMQGAQYEKSLLEAGITIIFSDGVSRPIRQRVIRRTACVVHSGYRRGAFATSVPVLWGGCPLPSNRP